MNEAMKRLEEWERRMDNKPKEKPPRHTTIFTELDIMQRGFLQHGVTPYKKKQVFMDMGIITEQHRGIRRSERIYKWIVYTTINNDDIVESEIKVY